MSNRDRRHGAWCTGILWGWAWFMAGAALSVLAQGQPGVDVGVLNQLQGEVRYRAAGAGVATAAPFMKIRTGDEFEVAAGARLRLVYFANGRQELWNGPARFTVGPAEGTARAGTPEVTQLPGAAGPRLAQSALLARVAQEGRPGGVVLRNLRPAPPAETLDEARARYAAMRATAEADDITPELVLLAALEAAQRHDEIRPLIEEMRKRQPDNPRIPDLARAAEAPRR